MNLFACQHCGQLLDFENTRCERCGHVLGYLPEQMTLSALTPIDGHRWRPLAAPEQTRRFCMNANYDVCNWLVADESQGELCTACGLNRTIPNLAELDGLPRWRRLESAKHRVVYGLLRLGLPVANRVEDPLGGLAFDFLADSTTWPGTEQYVLTGHRHGVITINVAEADDAARERVRQDLAEPYRTLLGHLRHEIGHYYWDRLVRGSPWLERVRALFGDDTRDYESSLREYHAAGPPVGAGERYISTYASAHPLEDWAESWAHYLHILDTLETAHAFGVQIAPEVGGDAAARSSVAFDPYGPVDFDDLVRAWMPLTHAVNSLNRSMGQPDLYPFVLREPALQKLRLVHDVIRDTQSLRGSEAPWG